MNIRNIRIGDELWASLGEDDMYGAESDADNVLKVRVIGVNKVHHDVEVRDVFGDEEFVLDPEQLFLCEENARGGSLEDSPEVR